MKFQKPGLTAAFFLVLLIVITLACNLPISITGVNSDIDKHTLVALTDATLISPKGEALDLPLISGMEWECTDIDGELSYVREHSDMTEAFILRESIVDLSFSYDLGMNRILLSYKYHHEMDTAVMDVNDSIIAWNHSKWFGESNEGTGTLERIGYFSGSFMVNETREGTYPAPVSSTVDEVHNFFGLIDKENPRLAYYCDLNAIEIPGNLGDLTRENFRNFCQHYYYECASK